MKSKKIFNVLLLAVCSVVSSSTVAGQLSESEIEQVLSTLHKRDVEVGRICDGTSSDLRLRCTETALKAAVKKYPVTQNELRLKEEVATRRAIEEESIRAEKDRERSQSYGVMAIVASLFLLGAWGYRSASKSQKNDTKRIQCNADDFLEAGGSTTFSGYGIQQIAVDKDRQLITITVNTGRPPINLTSGEFRYESQSKKHYRTVTYDTGGNQTVYGSRGAIGTVYVPGQSRSYEKEVGISFYTTIYKNEDVVAVIEFGNDKATWELLDKILSKIQTWCRNQAKEIASTVLDTLCAKAGMEKEFISKARWGEGGVLLEAIAVDRSGKAVAVYNNGTETWIGTLKGASAQIVDNKLEIKVDDQAYREKHLTERRFAILERKSREALVEWEDRINLLAKNAAASA